jgi:hypothetical protein
MSDSKMGTKVVATLTHNDASLRGNAPHSAFEITLCGCYACGPIPRARTNPRDTKNALIWRFELFALTSGLVETWIVGS